MGVQPKYTEIPSDVESIYPVKQQVGVPIIRSSRKGKSCCCWFLIIVLVTLGFLTLLASFACAGFYFWVQEEVIRFTTDEPNTNILIHRMPDAELDLVMDRAKMFFDVLNAGQVPGEDLTVTADEINGFIAHSDYFRGNAFVEISEGEILINLSLPATGLPGGKGRYFAAQGVLDVADDKIVTTLATSYTISGVDGALLHAELETSWDDDGKLVLTIDSGKFLNWIVPQDYIDEKDNLLEDIYDCDDTTRVIKGIEGWSVENDKITIKARRPDETVGEAEETVGEESDHPDAAVATTASTLNYGTRLLRAVLF